MISLQYKCLFIHVPRTGGTSIEAMPGLFEQPQPQHLRAQDYYNALGEGIWDKLYTFTFVRNPWDRAVSAYLNAGEVRNPRGWSFEQWCCQYFCDEAQRWTGSWCERPRLAVFEQYDMLWPIEKFDFIGDYTTLHQDFATVCDAIGIGEYALPHLNKTRPTGKHYSEWHTPKTIEAIRKRFPHDIELFNYDYEQ
jgi:hypothetical protein